MAVWGKMSLTRLRNVSIHGGLSNQRLEFISLLPWTTDGLRKAPISARACVLGEAREAFGLGAYFVFTRYALFDI